MTLIEHTAGASWHALSYRDTPEEALALKARYEQLPEVSRVVEVASLVPPDQGPKLDMLPRHPPTPGEPAAARIPPILQRSAEHRRPAPAVAAAIDCRRPVAGRCVRDSLRQLQ